MKITYFGACCQREKIIDIILFYGKIHDGFFKKQQKDAD